MKRELITDIDSLASKVHNSNSRRYIIEAIDSFRVGSYRASILSTWVAVTFDLLQKIKDIAAIDGGDAKTFIDSFNEHVAKNTIDKLLKTEREILATAQRFELISNREFYELEKLRNDRHFCAHPSFSTDEDLFQPSAEQVRSNIVNALNFVLIQKPIQGKNAIVRLNTFIQGETFPDTYEDIKSILDNRFLSRSKSNFLPNACKVLLKTLGQTVWNDTNAEAQRRYVATLKVFFELESPTTKETIRKFFHDSNFETNSQLQHNCFSILSVDPTIWTLVEPANQLLIKNSVTRTPISQSKYLVDCLSVNGLGSAVKAYLETIEDGAFLRLVEANPTREFKDMLIHRLINNANYTKTRDIGNLLAGSFSKYLQSNDVNLILERAASDDQIWGYTNSDRILKDLYKKTKDRLLEQTSDAWRSTADSGHFGELRTFLISEGLITTV